MINASIITRWILFIVPILAILWIPGILSLTKFPKANVSLFLFLFVGLSVTGIDFCVLGLGRQIDLVEHLVDGFMGW